MKFTGYIYQYRVSFIILIFLSNPFWSSRCLAQQQTIDVYMQKVKQGQSISDETVLSDIKTSGDASFLYQSLKKYESDASRQVRLRALSIQYKMTKIIDDLNLRTNVVNSLSKAISDNDAFVWQFAARQLKTFSASDFSSQAKAMITDLLYQNDVDKEIILLAGVANISSATNRLSQIISDYNDSMPVKVGKWYGKPSWAAHLALARLGFKEDLNYCLQKFASEKDDVIRVSILLEHIAYIRQPDAINILQDYLKSEETLPPIIKGESGIKFCNYALKSLAESIKFFPVISSGVNYSNEQIELAKSWLKNHPNFIIIK